MGIFDVIKKKNIDKTEQFEDEYVRLRREYLKFEKEYLEKNKDTKYDFFGYLMTPDEIPFFVEANTKHNAGEFQFNNSITPCTPNLLRHCVENLLVDGRTFESQNLDLFIRKCTQISEYFSSFPKEEWERVISELLKYLKIPHHLTPTQLNELLSNLTIDKLNLINWGQFAKELKMQRQLPPSYNSKPEEVKVWLDSDGLARASLKFCSKTSPSIRELRIRKGKVFEKVNDGLTTFNEDISKIWSDFCGKTFERDFELNQKEK